MALLTSCSCVPWCLLHVFLMAWVYEQSYGADENAWMTSREPMNSLDAASLTQDVPKLNKESGK